MNKQVKFISLLAFATIGMTAKADNPFSLDPSKDMAKAVTIVDKKMTAGLAVGAAVVAEVAHSFSPKEYDDKGASRSVGTPQDPVLGDALYSLSHGMGFTAVNQWLFKDADMDLKGAVRGSVVAGFADYVAEKMAQTQMFQSVSRNTPGFRWVPFNIKFDDSIKRYAVMYVGTEVINKVIDKAIDMLPAGSKEAVKATVEAVKAVAPVAPEANTPAATPAAAVAAVATK